MTEPRNLRTAVVLAFSIAVSGRAAAQSAEAEALFTEADRFETEGKIAEACTAFEASNRIEPRAGTLIRLGECREAEGKLASAWSAYKDALTRVKDPTKRAVAEQRLAELQARLSYLTVSVPDEARIDGLAIARNGKVLDAVLWNRAVPVDGGTYEIAGSAPGHETWSTKIVVPNEGGRSTVDVPKFKVLQQIIGPSKPDPAGPTDVAPPSPFTMRRKIAIGVAGAGVIALSLGAIFGVQAGGYEDDAFALCPDPLTRCDDAARAQDLLDRGASRATLANVTLGIGGAMIVGAAVLWLTGAPRVAEKASVSAQIAPGHASAGLQVRF